MNIKENRCTKGGTEKKCLTEKCIAYYRYSSQNLPCIYCQSPNCGFEGKLHDVKGQKLRRQYFNVFLIFQTICFLMVYVFLIFKTVTNGNGTHFDSLKSFITPFHTFAILMLPFFILSFLNAHLFGKCICVLNESGIYSNQVFINWKDIHSITYYPHLPSKRFDYCYAKISGENIELLLPHAPSSLLSKAKRYNTNIRTTFSLIS